MKNIGKKDPEQHQKTAFLTSSYWEIGDKKAVFVCNWIYRKVIIFLFS